MENYVNDSHFLTGFVFFSYYCSPSLPFHFSSLPFHFFIWPTFTSILKLCLFFYFDSILRFISSHEKLLAGLKGSTRKDPSARLVFSGECIQCFALFCSTHYYIYPTLDSLYCRSQGLFSNLLHSSMKLWFHASLVTNHHKTHTFPQAIYNIYIYTLLL